MTGKRTYRWLATDRGPQHAFLVDRGNYSMCLIVLKDAHSWAPNAERPRCEWCQRRLALPANEKLQELP